MRFFYLTVVLVCIGIGVRAQNSFANPQLLDSIKKADFRPGTSESPRMSAIRIEDQNVPELDGLLQDLIWQQAPIATDFTQRTPDDGEAPSQPTEVRLLYTDTHLYVGILAKDSSPDSIVAPIFRRDGSEASDWIHIAIDSYNDKRTAFVFGVNPRGVQRDFMIIDNSNDDNSWNAVWEARAQIIEEGWSAELKIPLSQLRFSSQSTEQNWRINFQREIARTGEEVFWKPTPQSASGLVTNFAELDGIRNLKKPNRLEVLPYASADLTRIPDPNEGDPYYQRNDFSGQVGADLKYGITSDLTLSATINPDFGQVEADPAVINLTANESFFSEKRPFFLEGRDIFQFGNTKTFSRFGNPITFYSRRIGRSPQGNDEDANIDAEFVDKPDFTTIATAAKVSGKTRNGWSVGFLDAYTLKEKASYTTEAGNEGTFAVEPATNYLVARTKKDFNDGNTYFGGFASAVNRSIDGTYFEDFMRTSAYLGGVDFEHNFGNQNWVTSGAFSYSVINGSAEAIEKAQTSSVRFYDRVDSDKLSVDEDKTSLSGFATEVSVQKRGGEDHWLTSLTYSEVSPGYETNDIGFQNRADYRAVTTGVIYRETDPKRIQYYDYWFFKGNGWNYDGDIINNWFVLGGSFQFKNLWGFNFESNYSGKQYSDRSTRGGPVMEVPEAVRLTVNLSSNSNKPVSFDFGMHERRDAAGEFDNNVWAGITIRPTTFIQISVSPEIGFQKDIDQYVTDTEDPLAQQTYGKRYVFADIKQKTLSTSIRLNWTFSPTMSLQTYLRPFISSGNYTNFKEFAEPRTYNFDSYGTDIGTIQKMGEEYVVDPDAGGPAESFTFDEPDFNFRSVQGNAVFRWEYMPGSTLFLVWQQQRNELAEIGSFDLNRDVNAIFNTKPTNVFLIKVSYWFGS